VAVLGSGSRGNAVAISSGTTSILVDAGFGARTLARRATACGIDLADLSGIFLTHEHGDHARGAARLAHKVGCPIYGSAGTLAALRSGLDGAGTLELKPLESTAVGELGVTACHTSHDAAEPLALSVAETRTGQHVGIAYDLGRPTAQVRYLLRGAAALVLEANHDDVLLRTGPYPASVRDRIAGPGGHLSNRDAAELLQELYHPGLRLVVLAHLSDRCNREDLALKAVRAVLVRRGFQGKLHAARQSEALGPIELTTEQFALDGFS
jgi:phosphoribosyl 1,2-cyclic phosphodiesterase